MNAYRNTFILVAVLFIVLLIIVGPCRSPGPGLKGTMTTGGSGPTWVSVGDDRIFISNSKSSTIDCFYIDSGRYAGRIEGMTYVGRTLYSRKMKKLYASIGQIGQGILMEINPKTYNLERQVNVDRECRAFVLSPDGKFIYAVWGGWKEGPGWFTKTSTEDFQEYAAFGSTRESPTDIVLSADGKKAYIASHYAQRSLAEWLGDEEGEPVYYSVIEVFDTTDASLGSLKEIQVGLKPQSMATFGDGRYIIVASAGLENEIFDLPGFSIIDTETDEVIKEIFTPGYFPFMVIADDNLGKAFSTYLYKVPIAKDESVGEGTSAEDAMGPEVDDGIIAIEISRGDEGGDGAAEDTEQDVEFEYTGMFGRGFVCVDLHDYSVDIYENESGLPFSTLCMLDAHRMIGVSSLANRLVIFEAQILANQ